MFRRMFKLLGAVLIGAAVLCAAAPVGSISSPESFLLRGAGVPVAGIPNWLLLPGDNVATLSSAATITFKDGTHVILLKDSSARVDEAAGSVTLHLITGSMQVLPTGTSSVLFYVNDTAVNLRAGAATTVTASGGTKGAPVRALGRTPIAPPPTCPPVSNR